MSFKECREGTKEVDNLVDKFLAKIFTFNRDTVLGIAFLLAAIAGFSLVFAKGTQTITDMRPIEFKSQDNAQGINSDDVYKLSEENKTINAWVTGTVDNTNFIMLMSQDGSSLGFRCVGTMPEIVYLPVVDLHPDSRLSYSADNAEPYEMYAHQYDSRYIVNVINETAVEAFQAASSSKQFTLSAIDANSQPLSTTFDIPPIPDYLSCF